MWNHIINIHPGELLHTKTKKSRMNINFFFLIKKINNLHFLPNNILTRLFKKLKIYIKIIYVNYNNI